MHNDQLSFYKSIFLREQALTIKKFRFKILYKNLYPTEE